MVKTGYIIFVTNSGGGFNGNGDPLPATNVDSNPIEANLQVVRKEYIIVDANQQQRQASFICYVDKDKIPTGINLNTLVEIKLKDVRSNDLGTFQTQNIEFLDITKRIKIVV